MIDHLQFPARDNVAEKMEFLLRYAVLAPSTHNTQPWLFKITDSSCQIFLNPSLRLPEADPKGRDLYISIGCCLENLILAAKYFGMFERVEYRLTGNLAAEVFFHDSTGIHEAYEYLLSTIPKRINARGVFESRGIDSKLVEQIQSFISTEYQFEPPIKLLFITNKEDIVQLASLTAQGLRVAYTKSRFRKEMSHWIHNSLSRKLDGMPGYALRMPLLLSFIIPSTIRFFNIGKFLGKLNYQSFSSAPLVCGFFCSEESERTWLFTGRAAERIMLEYQSRGLQTSIFVASIEMGDLHKKVQDVFQTNLRPQFLFCIGYMANIQRKTPKYSAKEKLIQ